MSDPRLIEFRIQGLRTLADVTLHTDGLTVLVGENGTGKSSIIEAFAILRLLPEPAFLRRLTEVHGPPIELLRRGESELSLGIGFAVDNATYWYGVKLRANGSIWAVAHEHIYRGHRDGLQTLLRRDGAKFNQDIDPSVTEIADDQLALAYFGANAKAPGLHEAIEALRGIEIHLPFQTTASWALRSARLPGGARSATMLAPAERLELFGGNLVEAYQTLRNRSRAHWDETLGYVRLGIGGPLSDVVIETVARGYGELAVDFDGLGRIPASGLSDGQLAFLSFVAMFRLDQNRTMLALDEPETHFHPESLIRIVQLLEAIATKHPVVVATQSDRLLDALADPVRSTRVCELDARWSTQLRELDQTRFSAWAERFRGLGDVRAEGDLELLLKAEPTRPSEHSPV